MDYIPEELWSDYGSGPIGRKDAGEIPKRLLIAFRTRRKLENYSLQDDYITKYLDD